MPSGTLVQSCSGMAGLPRMRVLYLVPIRDAAPVRPPRSAVSSPRRPEEYGMSILDHWHPVLFSRDLGPKPVGVKLGGREIALFRTKSGTPAALDDICPHRRMRLSLGEVIGDKLQCKYHGWTFTCDGQGESPGTPKLHACATAYDVREEHGAVWVKSRDATPAFPKFEVDGYLPI